MVMCNHLQIAIWLCLAADLLFAWNYLDTTELAVNIGQNVTLACFPEGEVADEKVMWVKQDRSEQMSQWRIQADGSLSLPNVARDDSGVYTCALEDDQEETDGEAISGRDLDGAEVAVRSKYRLVVRTTPGELVNVSVHPSTVLALLMWELGDTGGCDVSHFTARYRLTHALQWLDVMPRHISPTTRQIDIYHLSPNATYTFQVWATNDVGPGIKTSLEGTTKHVVQEIELARHLLQGVDTFDTRVWVAAVAVVMGTLIVLSIGTCYLMFRDHHVTVWSSDDQEVMELVPHIILNPGFLEDPRRVPDENSNDQPHVAFNNNSIVRPIRV